MDSQKSKPAQNKQTQPKKCVKCKQFWGSQAYEGMCSTCYTKIHGKPKPVPKQQPKKQYDQTQKYKGQAKGAQLDKNKCFKCNKKIGLLGTECKCGYIYCNQHRMPEDHSCNYNYEAEGKDHLKKQITKLDHHKVDRIDSI